MRNADRLYKLKEAKTLKKPEKIVQKRKKKREKQNFRQAMEKELREHKSSFIVFYILRALAIVAFVRQLMRGSYESAFLDRKSVV